MTCPWPRLHLSTLYFSRPERLANLQLRCPEPTRSGFSQAAQYRSAPESHHVVGPRVQGQCHESLGGDVRLAYCTAPTIHMCHFDARLHAHAACVAAIGSGAERARAYSTSTAGWRRPKRPEMDWGRRREDAWPSTNSNTAGHPPSARLTRL
jgi:hypothetical protein